MKLSVSVLLFMASVYLGTSVHAQQTFTSCAAAFVDDRMVVDAYTPTGKCRLSATATGMLTVQTVELSTSAGKAVDKIDFNVAIRDTTTGTLHQYSTETYRQIPVQTVLARCKKGDQIVLLTVDDRYALPHNEMLVQ